MTHDHSPSDIASTPDARERKKDLHRAAWACSLGSALEYYDFALYTLASALIFGPLFFPEQTRAMSLIASFGTYFLGFAIRLRTYAVQLAFFLTADLGAGAIAFRAQTRRNPPALRNHALIDLLLYLASVVDALDAHIDEFDAEIG
mgnify:CR=1 FL=1